MLTIEPLNSDPKEYKFHNVNPFENLENENSEDEKSLYQSSSIFMVAIDSVPMFYCHTKSEAENQAVDYLRNLTRSYDRKYYITEKDNKIILTSTCNLYITQYDCVESVAEIVEIEYARNRNDEDNEDEDNEDEDNEDEDNEDEDDEDNDDEDDEDNDDDSS